jgi:hypothetical protein
MCSISKMMVQHPNVDLVNAEIGGCSNVGLSSSGMTINALRDLSIASQRTR